MYHYLLLDLDGTLTVSGEGITKSVVYALKKLGEPVPEPEILKKFIGPPLFDSFQRYCGFTPERAILAAATFRERYSTVGLFESGPVPGMPETIHRLRERGYVLALASSKPEHLCRPIVERFGYAADLREISGSHGEDERKCVAIRAAMDRLGLTEADRPAVLMIGDRKFDVEGAAECGIACLGVEFCGYAAPGELARAGAAAVVQTPAELEEFILTH